MHGKLIWWLNFSPILIAHTILFLSFAKKHTKQIISIYHKRALNVISIEFYALAQKLLSPVKTLFSSFFLSRSQASNRKNKKNKLFPTEILLSFGFHELAQMFFSERIERIVFDSQTHNIYTRQKGSQNAENKICVEYMRTRSEQNTKCLVEF